jgi:hypothetical protein
MHHSERIPTSFTATVDAANSRAGVIVAAQLQPAHPASDLDIEALGRTFLDASAGPAAVAGTGVIAARNVIEQGISSPDQTIWLSMGWLLTGAPDWPQL